MNGKVKNTIPIWIGIITYFLPSPQGLATDVWLYCSVFIASTVGIIIEPVAAALVGIIGVTDACLLGVGAQVVKGKA